MGQEEILRKLSNVLKEDIQNECQVVFILSRIRKYLELKEIKREYKFLNFYCNWALHSKINRTESVSEVLNNFIKSTDGGNFLNFDYLVDDLKKFIDKYCLPDKIIKDNENYKRFVNLLFGIYSDTPLEVPSGEKQIITISEGSENGDIAYSCNIVSTHPIKRKSTIVGIKIMKD